MEPMDVCIANVPFDGSDKSKVRPALVVKIKDNYVSVFKITSKYQNKSEKIKRAYYPIKNWEVAGLNRISYVDTLQTYDIDKATIFKNRPIGKLTKEDVSGLYQFYRQNVLKITHANETTVSRLLFCLKKNS